MSEGEKKARWISRKKERPLDGGYRSTDVDGSSFVVIGKVSTACKRVRNRRSGDG